MGTSNYCLGKMPEKDLRVASDVNIRMTKERVYNLKGWLDSKMHRVMMSCDLVSEVLL